MINVRILVLTVRTIIIDNCHMYILWLKHIFPDVNVHDPDGSEDRLG